jgi:glutathione S-transferase
VIPDEPLLLHIEAFWVCPWAMSCFVALREKGLPFATSHALFYDDQQLLRDYQDLALTARVPALQHGSFWVAESQAIVEYLEDVFPPPRFPRLLPEDPRQRARARQVMAWLRSDLMALRNEWDAAAIFYPSAPVPLSENGRRDVEKLVKVAERLVPEGATGILPEWCVADVDLAFALKRLVVNQSPIPPRLAAIADQIWRRPSVSEFVEHPRPPHSRLLGEARR